MDITDELEERAKSYEQSGPSAHHTAALLRKAKAEIELWRDRWEAEHQAHQATIKDADAQFNSM